MLGIGKNLHVTILVVILAASAALYAAMLTPDSFGYYHDDGLYVTTAKALATDQGYSIISLPGDPPQTKSPPFYPLLLSVIWSIHPHFPQNLTVMMLASAVAALISSWLTWLYLTKNGYASSWLALTVVGLAAINWRTVILASGVFSETFYSALSVGALHLAEKHENRFKGKATTMVALGLLLGFAFLARTTGVALLITLVCALLVRKVPPKAWLPFALGSLFVLVWAGWGLANRPPGGGVNAAYYESYYQTLMDVITEAQAQQNVSKLSVLLNIIAKNAYMFIVVSTPLVTLGLSYNWVAGFEGFSRILVVILVFITFALIVEGFLRHRASGFRLLHIYIVLYLALHLLWPYGAYDRFLMPILPFLMLFFVTEVQALGRLAWSEVRSSPAVARRLSAAFIGLVLVVLAGIGLYRHGPGGIGTLRSFCKASANRAAEDAEAIRWINDHTDTSDILVCYRDPSYYLYTGRKATRSSSLKQGGVVVGAVEDPNERAMAVFRIVEENKARYLIVTSTDFELEAQAEAYRASFKSLVEQSPEVFVPVYEFNGGQGRIYHIRDNAKPIS